MAAVLQVRGLAVEVAGRLLVEDVGFTVRARDKIGLVGRNGAGKTSLLRVLGGAAAPHAGVVHHSGALGYLSQDPKLDAVADDITGLTHVLSGRGLDEAMVRLEKLRVRLEEDASDAQRRAHTRALTTSSSTPVGTRPSPRCAVSAAGLGLGRDRLDLPIGVLSGGERRRVELARILFAGSDLLLLDEPTNHLDNDARDWLLGFLAKYRGALVVVSHDLNLLDAAITACSISIAARTTISAR